MGFVCNEEHCQLNPLALLLSRWTRNGPNPGERRMTYEDFLQGEMEERLVYIFGRDVYDAAIRAVQQVIADRRKSFEES